LISCPDIPNVSGGVPEESFTNWYDSISSLNFDNAKYDIKFDSSSYFDISNIRAEEKLISKKFYYNELGQKDKQKFYYCMEYPTYFK
jgi:coenzyme F420-reducing hydrogenase alpha subunit